MHSVPLKIFSTLSHYPSNLNFSFVYFSFPFFNFQNELVLSINKELNTNYHNIQTEILLLENPMHNLSILALKVKKK